MKNEVEISSARRHDTHNVGIMHCEAFPGFFLTRLGLRFLTLLYLGFSEINGGIFFVAKEEGRLVGFVAGTTRPQGFFRELMLRRWLRFAFAALEGVVRSPFTATRGCLAAVFYRGEVPSSIQGCPALLSSLAVLPVCSGRGIGKALVAAFVSEAHKSGCDSVYLLTDKADNDAVNSFYKSCGFKLLDAVKRGGGRMMNRWLIQIPSTETVMVQR